MSKILVIPDLHCPAQHPDAKAFIKEQYRLIRPDIVVCLNDLLDNHALGKWAVDPDGYSAGHELNRAIEEVHGTIGWIKKMIITNDNHTERIYKKAFNAGIPKRVLKPIEEIINSPRGWRFVENIIIEKVYYFHGEPFTGQNAHYKAMQAFRMSVALAHVHSHAGVQYYQNPINRIFAANFGSMINWKKAYNFNYGKVYANKPVNGLGEIQDGKKAFFHPMD